MFYVNIFGQFFLLPPAKYGQEVSLSNMTARNLAHFYHSQFYNIPLHSETWKNKKLFFRQFFLFEITFFFFVYKSVFIQHDSQIPCSFLKGQCHEILDPRFFFLNQALLGSWLTS
jgi:hypothetical protein